MTTTSVAPTNPEVPPQATNSFRFSLIQCGEFPDHAGRPDGFVRESVGRERDYDRHCRFAGASHDSPAAPDGLFYS